jgi:hypothetical protein
MTFGDKAQAKENDTHRAKGEQTCKKALSFLARE